MKLISNNQSVFKQLVNDTATEFGKSIDEITKDYFLIVIIKHFYINMSNNLFKTLNNL